MIRIHKIVYLLLLCEVAVGMFLFSKCLNVKLSCEETLQKIDAEIDMESIQLTYSMGYVMLEHGVALPLEKMERFQENTKVKELLEVRYLPYVTGVVHGGDTKLQLRVFWADDESYRLLGGEAAIAQNGYIGSRARKYLENYAGQQDTYWDGGMNMSENMLTIGEAWKCDLDQFQPMEASVEEAVLYEPLASVTEENQICLADCIILPLSWLQGVENEQEISVDCIVQFRWKSEEKSWGLLTEFLNELSADHSNYQYSLTQQSLKVHDSAADQIIPYQNSLYAGISVLAITTSGMIGVFIILLNKRRKTNAVAIACGATYRRLFTELYIEVFCVLVIGTGIGIGCSIPAVRKTEIRSLGMVAQMHWTVVLLCLVIAALSALLICGIATMVVRKGQIAEVLKEA